MNVRSIRDRLERIARNALNRTKLAAPPPRPPAPPAVTPEPPPAPKPTNWELRTPGELIDHIISHYHEGLRRDLPVLVATARTLEREHTDHPERPRGLSDAIEALANDLDSHMLKEERMLFPMLRTGERGGSVSMPIRMMERDHDGQDEMLTTIRSIARDFRAPDGAPPAWTQLYADLAALESALHEHVYLENSVLFARAVGTDQM